MTRKILSLDGGGIKGVFIVSLLAEIEEKRNIKICDYFDLIAGTSTGGIIAAALALGISAREIEELYMHHAKDIFPQKKWRNVFRIWGGMYKSEPLMQSLEDEFGSLKISDCKTRLVIPSFNLSTCKPQVFKTSHSSDLEYDYHKRITEILMNTTAAPTYFKPNITYRGVYVDGGIGANNPSSIAVIEGITRCGWIASDIRLLSIGCTKDMGKVSIGKEKMGIWDIPKLINIYMEAESEYSSNMAQLILGKNSCMRINPVIPKDIAALDNSDSKSITYLKQRGMDVAQNKLEVISKMFLGQRKEEFIPSHNGEEYS